MRIGIVSDIHEDIIMLEKAVELLKKQGMDVLVCLGDITGYSPKYYTHQPDANACINFLREHNAIVVSGNHDLFTSRKLPSYHKEKKIPEHWYELTHGEQSEISKDRLWLYESETLPGISSENFEYLLHLPEWHILENGSEKYMFSHFFKPDIAGIERRFPAILLEIREHFRFMKEQGCLHSFVGHWHTPGPMLLSRFFWSHPVHQSRVLSSKHRVVICPAIVGGAHKSGCVLFDTNTRELLPIKIS